MINIGKIVRIMEAMAVENQKKEQIMQLHVAVEKLCVILLEDAITNTTPNKKVIEIAKEALKANAADKKSCVDALTYLWAELRCMELCAGDSPLSEGYKKAKEAIDACFLQHKAIIDAVILGTI